VIRQGAGLPEDQVRDFAEAVHTILGSEHVTSLRTYGSPGAAYQRLLPGVVAVVRIELDTLVSADALTPELLTAATANLAENLASTPHAAPDPSGGATTERVPS
jgi:hypothetical protein